MVPPPPEPYGLQQKARWLEITHTSTRRAINVKSTFTNLVYSCEVCNGYKSDFFPGDGEYLPGRFLYRPDRKPDPTYQLDGHKLSPETDLDGFNIDLLFLNREPLVKLRQLREKLFQSREWIMMGIRSLRQMRIDQIPPAIRGRLPGRIPKKRYFSMNSLLVPSRRVS